MAMKTLRDSWSTRLQPQAAFSDARGEGHRMVQRRLATGVGLVAFALPVVLLLSGWWGLSCYRDSISHFYFAHIMGDVFVIGLAFIATFLFVYQGEHWAESLLTTVAGAATLVVALMPTTGSGCPTWEDYSGRMFGRVVPGEAEGTYVLQVHEDLEAYHIAHAVAGSWHFVAAGVLFVFLALYCLIVMTRVVHGRHDRDSAAQADKAWRNRIYVAMGIVILVAVGLLSLRGAVGAHWFRTERLDAWLDTWWNAYNVTYVLETAMLWAFGLAWVVKGRFDEWCRDRLKGWALQEQPDASGR